MSITTTSGLIANLSSIQSKKLEAQALIMKLELELEDNDLVKRIHKWKELIKELNLQDIELRNNWIEILNKAGIDKFEANGVIVKLKTSPWKLIILDEKLVPDEYKKEVVKTTINIDKREIKENLKLWEIIEWVSLQQDITLEVKYK